MKRIITISLVLFSIASYGQKKALDHSVYDNWKSIGNVQITEDGKFALYQVNAQEGDGYVLSYACVVLHYLYMLKHVTQ